MADLAGAVAVEDPRGEVLYGDASVRGDPVPITHGQERVGTVRGPGATQVAGLLGHLFTAESEKRALADETLGRYKELSLLYDMSDALSHVLDVEQVAAMVVEQAHRALNAERSALLLHDVANDTLDPIATRVDRGAAPAARPARAGTEGAVLSHGRAELSAVESEASAMYAPMRAGEQVFGILMVEHDLPLFWSSGDLKLLSSMAAHSAAAISHARIHADHLRREALRGRIERFLSPHLAAAALTGQDLRDPAAVIFVDVGGVTSASEQPEVVLQLAASLALDVLMQSGATVDATSGEMLVGVFVDPQGFASAARTATEVAIAILSAFDLRFGGPFAHVPGVGVAQAAISEGNPRDALLAGVSAAATLQSLSRGRVLVDPHVAGATRDLFETIEADSYEDRDGASVAHEVRV